MKVKNIMFSGVMAAILGATGANAAINVASQGYVDSKVGEVSTNITNNYLTKTDAQNTYLTETQVQQEIKDVVGDSTSGVVADVAANKAAIEALDDKYATDTALTDGLADKADKATTLAGYGITDAYTKTEADNLLATKQGTLTPGAGIKIENGTISTDGIATDASLSALEGKVSALEAATGENGSIASNIADALTEAKGYTDSMKTTIETAYAAADADLQTQITANATGVSEAKAAAAKALTDAKAYTDTVDAKFANYTTTEGLTTKLADYALQTSLDAEKTARETADAATTEALKAYTKTADLDAGFVSETEMTAFKETNTAAINAKVAQSDYDTKVAALEAKDTELAEALAKTIEMPAACETQDCVLSINKASGKVAWVPLTEPVSEFLNK